MEKLNVKKYNISQLILDAPQKITNGYNFRILYNGNDFCLQTPLCLVNEVDIKSPKPYIKVSFELAKNFSHFQFFCGLNQQIKEMVESRGFVKNFDSSSKRENDLMTLYIKLNKETKYFDKKQTEISGLEIKKGDKVVILLENRGVFADEKGVIFRWTGSQILRFKEIN